MLKILLMSLLSVNLFAISNYDVAKKCDEAMRGFIDSRSDVSMMLINSNKQMRERKMSMIIFEKAGGDLSLMTFLSPSDVKGSQFLNHEHVKKDDDQWLYLPALKRVKRITSDSKSGSFMGSEFSYEDLSSFDVDKYTYKGDAKIVTLNGKKVYQGERFAVGENSGYGKQVSWIDAGSFLTLKVEYYDRKNEPIKVALFEDYKKISGVWRVGKTTMTNNQNGKETVLVWKNETIKNGLKEEDFNQRVLGE
jgi:outer membrane lipoprotein-sorting protein